MAEITFSCLISVLISVLVFSYYSYVSAIYVHKNLIMSFHIAATNRRKTFQGSNLLCSWNVLPLSIAATYSKCSVSVAFLCIVYRSMSRHGIICYVLYSQVCSFKTCYITHVVSIGMAGYSVHFVTVWCMYVYLYILI